MLRLFDRIPEVLVPLRPYQQAAVDATVAGWSEFRKQLLVMPTGSGKTVAFAHLAYRSLPSRTLILAHRDELIQQAVDKIEHAVAISADIEKAELRASMGADVVVGSVQTLIRRFEKFPKDHFGLVVCDEAHHAISDSWQKVLSHFDQCKVLGVTATPDRGDKKNLGKYFENIAYEVGLVELINQGYLCPIVIQTVPLKIDLSQVRTVAGDYKDDDLDAAIKPYLGEIARSLKERASGRKTLAFLPLIATSKDFVAACQAVGLRAQHIDGQSPDRREILRAFKAGAYDVLSCAMLLTEGFDEPSIGCVLMLRPTKSRPLFAQAIGRGTRIHLGKENLLILDFLWLHEKHNLVRAASLVAQTEAVAEAMTQAAAKGGEHDLLGLESVVRSQREKALMDEIKRNERRRAKTISAVEFCLEIHALEAAEFEPTMGWHEKGVTVAQRKAIENLGLDPESVKSRGHASAVIDALFSRRKQGLATPKQLVYLRRFGHSCPEKATFIEASRFLNKAFAVKEKSGTG